MIPELPRVHAVLLLMAAKVGTAILLVLLALMVASAFVAPRILVLGAAQVATAILVF